MLKKKLHNKIDVEQIYDNEQKSSLQYNQNWFLVLKTKIKLYATQLKRLQRSKQLWFMFINRFLSFMRYQLLAYRNLNILNKYKLFFISILILLDIVQIVI